MPIFGKKPDQPQQPSAAPAPAPPPVQRPRSTLPPPPAAAPAGKRSFLGPGCEFEGDIKGAGSLECRGQFTGTIDVAEDVVIGRGGVAKAQLKARRITIEGRLDGDATGGEKVEVGPTGHVEGDVRAPAVQFAEGAFFEGNVEMRRAKGQDEAAGGPAAAPAAAGGPGAASAPKPK